jgi:large subunit ribosomal protein L9
MKLILTKDVSGVGRAGEVKEVSDGYARNFLIPRRLALPATTPALERIQKEEKERQEKTSRNQEKILTWKNQLESRTFTVKAKANEKTLFAAVHEKDIVAAINAKLNSELSPDQIRIAEPIKALGLFIVEIRLTEGVTANTKLNIEPI